MAEPEPPFKIAPPPWSTKCEAYVCAFWRSPSLGVPKDAYDPVEAPSFNTKGRPDSETYLGGLCLVQIIRYSETPVGAYDELAIMPGFFQPAGSKTKHSRVTRIYVSQKDTCYNGRKNWNIPKHLARFEFTVTSSERSALLNQNQDQDLQVKVFPHTAPDDSSPQPSPFFTATLRKIRYTPTIPFSTSWLSYLGFDMRLLQPPVPAGESAEECCTHEWRKSLAKLESRKASLTWFSMKIAGAEESAAFLPHDAGKWWAKWLLGLRLQDATLEIGEPEAVEL